MLLCEKGHEVEAWEMHEEDLETFQLCELDYSDLEEYRIPEERCPHCQKR